MATPMEIERKWMVEGWPEHNEDDLPEGGLRLPLLVTLEMAQGYVTTKPTVRIRSGKSCFPQMVNRLEMKNTFSVSSPKVETAASLARSWNSPWTKKNSENWRSSLAFLSSKK